MDKKVGRGGSNLKVLDKKVPRNPKYEHIQGKLKTGPTINQVEIMSDKLVSKRKGELFKRIKCSTVSKLITESITKESIY